MNRYLQKLKSGNWIETVLDYALGFIKYSGDSEIEEKYKYIISHKRKIQYYKKIKKNILPEALKRAQQLNFYEEEGEKTIWFCWFQGMENAPEVVKKCYESQKKYLCADGEWKIQIITEDNMLEYAALPQIILDKYKKGIISRAHFSDLLRVQLLTEHGGLWCDSTVLVTDTRLWKNLQGVDLFLFNNWQHHSSDIKANENYFIKSNKHNKLLVLMQQIMYCYWEKYDYACHYFLWQTCFQLIAQTYPDEYKKIPVINKVAADQLALNLFEPYDETGWNIEKLQSDIHKMSWKYPNNELSKKGTLYEYIMIHEV